MSALSALGRAQRRTHRNIDNSHGTQISHRHRLRRCFSPLLTQSPADPRFVLTSPSFRIIVVGASVPLILPVTHQKARNYTCALLIFAYQGPTPRYLLLWTAFITSFSQSDTQARRGVHALGAVTRTALHPFPLAKLYESLAAPHLHTACTEKFPSSLCVMGSLTIVLHPWLLLVSASTGWRYSSSFSKKSGSVLLLHKLLDPL